MKSLNTTHTILTAAALVSLFVIFNFTAAQPAPQSGLLTSTEMSFTLPGNPVTAASKSAKSNAVAEMFNNASYWVDYLRNTVSIEKEELNIAPDVTNEVNTMETSPDYWPETLKTIISNENQSAVQPMEADPAYWKHYLQSVVDAENALL